MVKADLTRDYYGDLELAPTADVLEIKKQFKKLGRLSFSSVGPFVWYPSLVYPSDVLLCGRLVSIVGWVPWR